MPSIKQVRGKRGEAIARQFLENKRYRFIHQGWQNRFGEIDLIMWDDEELVFVEVKMRKNTSFGRPEEMVSYDKFDRLKKTASAYLELQDLQDVFWRFDIVAITGDTQDYQILHLKDALRED